MVVVKAICTYKCANGVRREASITLEPQPGGWNVLAVFREPGTSRRYRFFSTNQNCAAVLDEVGQRYLLHNPVRVATVAVSYFS